MKIIQGHNWFYDFSKDCMNAIIKMKYKDGEKILIVTPELYRYIITTPILFDYVELHPNNIYTETPYGFKILNRRSLEKNTAYMINIMGLPKDIIKIKNIKIEVNKK